MAAAVSCRQSAARGLASFGLRQRQLCCGNLPRTQGDDCYYYLTWRWSTLPLCHKQKLEVCNGRSTRRISSSVWATHAAAHIQSRTKRQPVVAVRTAGAHSLNFGPTHFPDLERAQVPMYGLLHSACSGKSFPSDVRLQSLICILDEEVSMQLVVSGRGKEQTALLEVPSSRSVHLQQLVASRVESLPAEQAGALLLAQLEGILDSITTVDGCNADDIAVEQHVSSNSDSRAVVKELVDESVPESLTGKPEGTGMPLASVRLCHPDVPSEMTANLWDVHEGHSDSVRSLFDSDYCPMSYHLAFEHLTASAQRLGALAAFSGTGNLASVSSHKKEPSMEEHLAVLYEKLRVELPNFFLKPHDYGMYSPNVEFISQFPRIKTRGRTTYQAVVMLLRFLAWNYCADVHMEVMKMTQHPEDWTIQVRWRITGLPLHVLILKFYKKDKTELYRTYDAYSTFYLGPDGLIHRHKIDKMMPTQPPLTKVKTLLVGALVALGLEEHRPALNLLLAQSAGKVGEKHC
ncbi:uncharacterized protein C6orf136 homolog [Stegostoma tigrinum]|uniref:uncharacterized protein C6orf136 homolog n=1 Tax=Stegostoma tigrinum TaxID=3053191 RepID=UPI0028705663|nr:uncharacterized protein C6orf136 homolog [Stegostoma tigrinum]XP_059495358.1 uncharacterized protein C6orf136 homolog [Stegostoma tigrinum]